MQRILSTQLSTHVGETVRVAGWIHRRRLLKSVAFLILRDAAGLTQIVVNDESDARAAGSPARGDDGFGRRHWSRASRPRRAASRSPSR